MIDRSPAFSVRAMTEDDTDVVVALWDRCGLTRPHNDPHRDITFARSGPNSNVLVGLVAGEIIASVMVGHDGHRGSVYYLSVDPDHRGKGLGHEIMAAAEQWLVDRGVWKLNLLMRRQNAGVIGFYESLGYDEEPNIQMARWLDPLKRSAH